MILKKLLALSFLIAPLGAHANEIGKVYDTNKVSRRIEAKGFSLFSFGANALSNVGNSDVGQFLSFSQIWETTPYASIKAGVDAGFATGDVFASYTTLSLGPNFYLTATNLSPYIGFDFGIGGSTSEDKNIGNSFGWAGGLSAGVALFRVSSVQLHLQARYSAIFKTNKKGLPSSTSLGLGLAF